MNVSELLEKQRAELEKMQSRTGRINRAAAAAAVGPFIMSRKQAMRDYYADRFNRATTSAELKDVVRDLQRAEFAIQVDKLSAKNRLAALLNYSSGDSWNGSHFLNIDVVADASGIVTVYNMNVGHNVSNSFTQQELAKLAADDVTQYTPHYPEFASSAERAGLKLKP